MSDQYFRDRFNTTGNIASAPQEAINPTINSDLIAQKDSEDTVLVQQLPMNRANSNAMYETPIQQVPVSGTVTAAAPLTETIPYPAAAGVVIANDYQVSKDVFYVVPTAETVTPAVPAVTSAVPTAALLSQEDSEHFRTHWNEIQAKFVDEPHTAVQQADALVSEVIAQITQMFTREHSTLDSQWNQGSEVSTEDLRKALQHYRTFFNRLVV